MKELETLGDITSSRPATYHHDPTAQELTIRLHKPVPAYELADAPNGAVCITSRLFARRNGQALDVRFINLPKSERIGKSRIKKIQVIEVLVTDLSDFKGLSDGERVGFAYRGAARRPRGHAKRG